MQQAPIQIGWIPYLNLLPLRHEITRLSAGQHKLQCGHPSSVNRWLMDGSVQLAPASSIALLKSKELEMAFPIGIASEGPVQSVYIGLYREHEAFYDMVRDRQMVLHERIRDAMLMAPDDMRRSAALVWSSTKAERISTTPPHLLLTSASAASAALTRVLMNLWLGEESAAHVMAKATVKSPIAQSELLCRDVGSHPMELVIGDEALQRRHEFWKVLDLGQIWFELTGLPFVFALWQTTVPQPSSALKYLVTEAASIAQARMRVEPHDYFPTSVPVCGDGKLVDLAGYWKVIQYKMTQRHLRSLLLYFSLYQQTRGRLYDEDDSERFVRWNKTWTGVDSIAAQ
jgi:predicted solute-binding protein